MVATLSFKNVAASCTFRVSGKEGVNPVNSSHRISLMMDFKKSLNSCSVRVVRNDALIVKGLFYPLYYKVGEIICDCLGTWTLRVGGYRPLLFFANLRLDEFGKLQYCL